MASIESVAHSLTFETIEMEPVFETRGKKQAKHSLNHPSMKNDIYDLVTKVTKMTIPIDVESLGRSDVIGSRSSVRTTKTINVSDYNEDPNDYFVNIILDLIPNVCMSDNDRIMERYDNKMNPFNGKPAIGEKLKLMNCTKIGECLQYLKIKPFPNVYSSQLRHIPVAQQHRGSECGFHMLWNAKCMLRVILA